MDPISSFDKDSSLAPTDLSTAESVNVFEMDQRSLRVRRKTPAKSCRQLCAIFVIPVVLIFSAGFVYLLYSAARGFMSILSEPYSHTFATDDTSSVIKSYYGERVPYFDVVANVYIRFGKELAVSNSGENDTESSVPKEEEMFGEWESIFSQVIYSHMDLNSTTKIFYKTVDLPISQDVLARMYQPHTYFPQIVNTFAVVPSGPDPALSLPHPPTLTAFNQTDAVRLNPTLTSWTQYPLEKLARPVDPQPDTIGNDDESRWRNISASLDAFYDVTAVKEFALRPVLDRWTTWSQLEPSKNGANLTTTDILPTQNEMDERSGLSVRRNASIKIKTSTWISVARQTPVYDLERYLYLKNSGIIENMISTPGPIDHDQLNRLGPHIKHIDAYVASHTPSHLVLNVSSTGTSIEKGELETEIEHSLAFYGPNVALRGHAAGSHDWISLPRVNVSSMDQSDLFVVPWRIAFELQSNLKNFVMGSSNGIIYDSTETPDEHSINSAYNEASALESRELWNAILGYDDGSSRRPVSRAILHFMGFLLGDLTLLILQVHYVCTRNLSTGISIPPRLLTLALRIIKLVFRFQSEPFLMKAFIAVAMSYNLGEVWVWVCLWWGFNIQWSGRYEWLPTGVKRNKLTHSERRSRRVDSQFTWFQRGLLVAVLTICLAHIMKLPNLISPTHRYTSTPAPIISPPSSYIGGLVHIISYFKFTIWFNDAIDLMGVASQMLLNKRLGCFGGSYPSFAWAEFMAMIFNWTPTILHSTFGKSHVSDPVHPWTVFIFLMNGVLFWQALKYPVVKQSEDEDE